MGGRRARNVSEIVGEGLRVEKGQFTRALKSKDPEAIAQGSARLLAKSSKTTEILYYATKLADFVRKQVKEGKALTHAERESLVRKEWSRIKKAEKLPDDAIATPAIVAAATKAIGGRKR